MTDENGQNDFEKFDNGMGGLLAVPCQQLHKELIK
jgi:hypothetical protein